MLRYNGLPLVLRLIVNLAAALLMGFGISMYYAVGLGADPVSVFMEGLGAHIGLSSGTTTSLFNCLVVLVFLLFDRSKVHIGTFVQAVFVGIGINLSMGLWAAVLPGGLPLVVKLLFCLGGALACGNALALYLACELGASAVDMLILTTAARLKKSYKWGFYVVYAIFMVLGILFGGRWGIGTVISLVFTGLITDFMIPRYKAGLERADARWGR